MPKRILSLDLGGTRIRAACLDEQLNILKREETLTLAHEGYDGVFPRIVATLRAVLPDDGSPVEGIGISSPGPLDPAAGVIIACLNLPGWHNVPLAARVSEQFGGVPTYLNKDANVAGLAEALRGAARGCRHMVYITLSTGIGGGVIADGRMVVGAHGIATEIGSILLEIDGRVVEFENDTRGPILADKARARVAGGESSLLTALADGDLNRIDPKLIGEAARQGDALALDIIRRAGTIIGIGVTNLLHLFNPEILVFGGGLSKLGDLLFDPIRASIRQHAFRPFWEDLRIEMAALGDDAGLVGAGALVITEGGLADVAAAAEKLNAEWKVE